MTFTRRSFGGLALGSLAAGAIAAGLPRAARAQEAPIRIGAINPYSGPMAQYGDEVARGYELAAARVNAAGGLLGRQVEILRGNATSPQEALGAVEQLVGREEVDILAGTYVTAISNSASEGALNYGKLYWETNALSVSLTDRGLPNFARSGPSSNEFARRSVEAVMELILPKIGKTADTVTVWIEHEDSAYGTSIKDEQVRLFEAAGVTPQVSAHSAKSIDVTDSILRAKAAMPDVWMNTGYVGDTNLLLRAARDQGFKPPVLMLNGVGDTRETLEALGEEFLDGVLIVSYPRPDINPAYGPGAAAYLESYRKAYNQDPVAPQGLNAFVGMSILFEAIAAAESLDYEAILAAAREMDKPERSYETGYGVKFSDTMQNTRALPVVAQWQGGAVRAIYPPEAMSEGVAIVNLPRS